MAEKTLLEAVRDAAQVSVADMSADELRKHRPDLVSAIEASVDASPKVAAARKEGEDAGRVAGATAERERLEGIDKLMPVGMEKLRDEMKADSTVTPEKAAVRFLEASNTQTTQRLQGLKDAGKLAEVPAAPHAGGSADAVTEQVAQGEDAWKAEFAKGQTGFENEADYIAFNKAEGRGGVRILGARSAA